MHLIEIFNKVYPYEKKDAGSMNDEYVFKTDSGSEIAVHFDDSAGPVHIQFRSPGSKDQFSLTGKGDAYAILSTVNKIVEEVISRTKPDAFWFTADEPSRQKLYDRLAKRFDGHLGYRQVTDGPHFDNLRELLDFDSQDTFRGKLYYFEDPHAFD